MQNVKLKISVQKVKFLIFTFTFLIFNFSMAYASETDWSVHIKVSVPDSRGADGTIWNHLIAGVRESATDGFDSAWDTVSMIETDDPVQAMFTHGTIPEDKNSDGMIDNWTCNSAEEKYSNYNCSLWRDMRAFDIDKVWSFLILSPLNGGTVTLEWSFEDRPGDMEILLVDLSNPAGSIDMKNANRYSYTNNFESGKKYGIRYVEIRVKMRGLFITLPSLPDATIDTPYSARLVALGGAPEWSLENGALPPGMSMDAYTGEVGGTPAATGAYRFTVKGYDPLNGYSSLRVYTINVNPKPKINIARLSDGLVGSAYSDHIPVTGGTTPIIWNIIGNLPEGVTLDSKTGIISGRLIVPGIYDLIVTIKDRNGAMDSRDFSITVTEPEDKYPPKAISDLRGLYATDTSMLLIWSAPSDDSMTRTAALYDLRYVEDCPLAAELGDSTWDKAIEASGEPRPMAEALQTFTLTGLTIGKSYCIAIKGIDASGHVSPVSNIVAVSSDRTISISGSGGAELASSMILKRGYNLISFPLIPLPNGRETLLGSIVGSPAALYRWYSAYPGITPPQYYLEDIVQPGSGYFLYSPADNLRLDVSGLKVTEAEYSVPLQHEWNMIGTPYDKAILLSDILVRDNISGEQRSFIDAVKGGWIGNTLYNLEGGNYDFASFNDDLPAALEPWVGYWIYVGAESSVERIFRRP